MKTNQAITEIQRRLDRLEDTERALRAIRIYCEGVREDFPEATPWMTNIIHMATLEES